MTKPMIVSLNGPTNLQSGVSHASTLGTATAVSALSAAVDQTSIPEEDLLYVLTFRNAIAKRASERASWVLGRWYNKLSGEDPDYVTLSGAHLTQTLDAANRNAPTGVMRTGQYKLRADIVEDAIARLTQQQPASPDKS